MSFRRLTAAALLLACGAGHTAERCALPDEYRALNARVLQTRLMVAALACGSQAQFNAVVAGLRPALSAQGAMLRAYFGRTCGSTAERRLDAFVTRLANEQSLLSTRDRPAFCAAGKRLFAALAATVPAGFDRLLDDRELAAAHRVAACGAPRRDERSSSAE